MTKRFGSVVLYVCAVSLLVSGTLGLYNFGADVSNRQIYGACMMLMGMLALRGVANEER